MYKKFYEFSEKPFNNTPDPKFFFCSPQHLEALNSLRYAIEEKQGFVLITGEIGSGKTTVNRILLYQLSLSTRFALITNTHITPKGLILEMLEEFGIEHRGGDKQKLLSALNSYLIKQLSANINVVLIIDEAQNLTLKVLEEIRMLSNLETEREKLIQIILLGQPQLKAKLENPRLEQFRQRIAMTYHLSPLSRKETEQYILHRVKLASSPSVRSQDLFTNEAIEAIYAYSRGTPRLINMISDSALLTGFVYESRQITAKIVEEVIKEREICRVSNADLEDNTVMALN